MDAATTAFAERQLAALLPALVAGTATDEARAACEQDVRQLFAALQPRDVAEAAMAIRAVVAYFNWRTLAAKANRSDALPDQTRILASARAEGRIFDVTERTLERRRTPPPQRSERARPNREPAEAPSTESQAVEPQPAPPPVERFQPRDRHGAPIPLHLWDQMTVTQRRAAFANPPDRALWDAAREEEAAAMLAEQQAPDAASGVMPAG
jgi:hypothetical protein